MPAWFLLACLVLGFLAVPLGLRWGTALRLIFWSVLGIIAAEYVAGLV
jgi:hypothetical protein